jgi:hypothetical protein
MQFWNILFIISIVIFALSILVLAIFRFRKNVYLKPFQDDELFDTKNVNGIKSYYYFTSLETKKYIKRYVFRKSPYQRNVILNFSDNFKKISYYILAYSRTKKVIDVVEVTEKPYGVSSRVINLNRKTCYVNIFVKSVDGLDINTNIIQPIPVIKIKYYTTFSALAIFAILFAVRHLVVVIMGGLHAKDFLNSTTNLFLILGTFGVSFLYWICARISLRKKNHQNRRGGSHEYEFF